VEARQLLPPLRELTFMQTRKLANTDLEVSRACFGNMTFGSQTDEAAAGRLIDLLADRGVNFLDTANVYNSGQSETILGNVLKGRRDKFVLASKVGFPEGVAGGAPPSSRAAILESIDGSLRRLQTDHLDIYYLHVPDYKTPIEETLEAIDQVRRAGKARSIGISNYASWQVCETFWISEKKGYQPPAVTQPMYNLLARGIEQEYLAFCKKYQISLIVYNPLAGGLLTGKQKREQPLPGTRFDNNKLYLDRYWHPAFFDAVDELAGVARQAGRSLIDLSINWLLHHTATDSIILGASRIDQLEENLAAFDGSPLSADTLAACDEVWRKLRGVTPNYNR
jgi:aryl-alcohol dehydrogenase-like predicted oxidoreductase